MKMLQLDSLEQNTENKRFEFVVEWNEDNRRGRLNLGA